MHSRKTRYRNNHGTNSTPGLEEPLPLATAPEPDSPTEEAPADGPAEDPDPVFEGSASLRGVRAEIHTSGDTGATINDVPLKDEPQGRERAGNGGGLYPEMMRIIRRLKEERI